MTAARPALPPAMMLAAMDAVSDGIVIVDKDSRIIYINDAYTRILRVGSTGHAKILPHHKPVLIA